MQYCNIYPEEAVGTAGLPSNIERDPNEETAFHDFNEYVHTAARDRQAGASS
jgi:hypothetical protein